MEVNGSQDYFVINIPQNMSSALSSIVFASFKKKKEVYTEVTDFRGSFSYLYFF